jgi:hypothetical protein
MPLLVLRRLGAGESGGGPPRCPCGSSSEGTWKRTCSPLCALWAWMSDKGREKPSGWSRGESLCGARKDGLSEQEPMQGTKQRLG